MECEVTNYYLEMTDRNLLIPRRTENPDFEVKKAKIPLPELNRFFYSSVGYKWYWFDRAGWTYQQWKEWVDRPELQTWIAYVSNTPAGYFELEMQSNKNVEITCFGLLPSFIGQGLGGSLLTIAVEKAWEMNPSRVWLNTCSLDHPVALLNYLARGFKIFKKQSQIKVITSVTHNFDF